VLPNGVLRSKTSQFYNKNNVSRIEFLKFYNSNGIY